MVQKSHDVVMTGFLVLLIIGATKSEILNPFFTDLTFFGLCIFITLSFGVPVIIWEVKIAPYRPKCPNCGETIVYRMAVILKKTKKCQACKMEILEKEIKIQRQQRDH